MPDTSNNTYTNGHDHYSPEVDTGINATGVHTFAYPMEDERNLLPESTLVVDEVYPYQSHSDKFENMGFATRAIHCGNAPDPSTGAVNPPIYMSSTFSVRTPIVNKGYTYTRTSNPGYRTPEQQIASLEGGKYCLLFGSGISAIASIGLDLHTGDCVLCFSSCYSGTFNFLAKYSQSNKVEVIFIPIDNSVLLEELMRTKRPKYMFFESPTNPKMDVCDIMETCKIAHKYNCITVFDNTFSTPYVLQPLQLGVDIVVHSTTKFLNGHSDILSGAIITNSPIHYETAHFHRRTLGMIPSPFDSWLLARSIKSFQVRMERHCESAMKFASHFECHPHINYVNFPGLPSHKYHNIAKKQMKNGYGGMMSIDINVPNLKQTYVFLENLQIFTLGISLGGIESLVNHSTTMTHGIIPQQIKEEVGITDTLLRVSIGLEDVEDLIHDFEQALIIARS